MTADALTASDAAAIGCRICTAPVVGPELLFCAGHRVAVPRRLVLDLVLHAADPTVPGMPGLPEQHSVAFSQAADRAIAALERLERVEARRRLERDQLAIDLGPDLTGPSERPRPSTRSKRRRPGVQPVNKEVTAWHA